MDLDGRSPVSTGTRRLVADWTLDPHAIVAACPAPEHGPLRLVVPAWLHGLDWVGDPWASVPCAERQLEQLAPLLAAAGLAVASAEVGDPDPLSAICDGLAAGPVEEILLFARGRHTSHRP